MAGACCDDDAAFRKVVLIDMDNTLVNFDKEFGKRWVAARPGLPIPEFIENRKHFELEQNFQGTDDRTLAEKIMAEPGFFIAFDPNPGAVQAVTEMLADGLEVFFCTAPHPLQYETCVAEKYAWVRKHFGDDHLKRLIITRDKTLVSGCVLIDDKPKITGALPSTAWTHLVFDQPYNRDVSADLPRLTSWANWRVELKKLLVK